MSTYGTEEGHIALPAAEFSKVRKAVELEEKKLKEYGFALASYIWQQAPRSAKKDRKSYTQAQFRLEPQLNDPSPHIATRYVSMPEPLRDTRLNREQVDYIVDVSRKIAREADRRSGKPARPQKQFLTLPTNRTTVFVLPEREIRFDKESNTVAWEVFEGNHSVDRVHKHPVFKSLVHSLDEVKWTRGTGGSSLYCWEHDGYGSDTTFAFGPVGAEHAPHACRPYTLSNGKRVTKFELQNRLNKGLYSGSYGRGPQPRGHNGHAGQYTYRDRGPSEVWL